MQFCEDKYHRLTHSQRRIWYLEKINTGSNLNNICGCLKIKESINVKLLKKAINNTIKMNDGIRLRICEKNGEPFQYVYPYKEENFDFKDFTIYEDINIVYEEWLEDKYKKNFNLYNDNLYEFIIYKLDSREYGCFFKIHHIICDGWSTSIIQRQVIDNYTKLINGESILSEPKYSYIDTIKTEDEYLNSNRFIKNKTYWNKEFENIQEEFLYNSTIDLKGNRKTFDIDVILSDEIYKTSNDNKCSVSTFFIVILLLYINKTLFKNDIVIGIPIFNRAGHKEKNIVGMFTSTMPFRIKIDSTLSFIEFLNIVNKKLKASLYNQKYPYDLLISDLQLSKIECDSLFKMSLNYYNAVYLADVNGIQTELVEHYGGNQSYSLQLVVREWKEGSISLDIDYKTSEYTSDDICTIYKSLINIIKHVVTNNHNKISDIKLIDIDEINYKTYTLNSTENRYQDGKMIYELFQEQVLILPDNSVAVQFEDKKLSYKQLNEKSNQMANFLREKGIKRQVVVAIMATHSVELVIGILGILKAGGTYLPIESTYPTERISYILGNSKSLLLLTNQEPSEDINFMGKVFNIKTIDLDQYDNKNLEILNTVDDIAYIIYTSGSTGEPKGVMVKQKGLVNYVLWACQTYLKEDIMEVVPLYSSISFDLTVTSIFMPLVSGNTINIYLSDETDFVLYKILRDNRATIVKLTPAHLNLLKDRDNKCSSITRLIVGGEILTTSLAKKVYDSFGGNIAIYNEYGPTEATVGCMIYKYDNLNDEGISVPIGRPIDNTQIYVLDQMLNIVPDGMNGEIYISGDGLAKGYLNQEKLTSERFIQNPFIEGEKMYKTGDLGYYQKNGLIVYIGRNDNQVKIRGFRIEIGEIEKSLLLNKYVKDAIVLCRENKKGDKFLNAYIIVQSEITELELKDWLLKYIPNYMIPNNFVFLHQFPLTSNGKVNYNLLPDIEEKVTEKESYITDLEMKVVKVIEDIIGYNNISMDDRYYQIGGDSIKAIQIVSKLKDMGLEVKTKDILSSKTIKDIMENVKKIEVNIHKNQEICSGNIKKTPIIEWFFNINLSNTNHYSQYILLQNKGIIDIQELKEFVEQLRLNHDMLRVNYNKNDDTLYYNNNSLNNNLFVNEIDLSAYSQKEQENKIKGIRKGLCKRINIECTSLFHVCSFKLGIRGQAILFVAHHLIIDGISWRILLNDFYTMIEQARKNENILLPEKTSTFKDWSIHLQEYAKNDFEEELYWRSVLSKKYLYPTDFVFITNGYNNIKKNARKVKDMNIRNLINQVNQVYGIKFNELLVIVLVLTINRTTHDSEMIIELERHGRETISDYIDISRTVGWFTSMYPAYFKVDNGNLESKIKSIKEQLRGIPNKGFNFGILNYIKHTIHENPHSYIRFNYLGDFDNIMKEFDLLKFEYGLENDEINNTTALMDVETAIIDNELIVNVSYSGMAFKNETIEEFIDSYMDILKEILNFSYNIEKVFTPSDFDTLDLEQEDLDKLFD